MYFPWSFPIVGILFYLFFIWNIGFLKDGFLKFLGEKARLGNFFFCPKFQYMDISKLICFLKYWNSFFLLLHLFHKVFILFGLMTTIQYLNIFSRVLFLIISYKYN